MKIETYSEKYTDEIISLILSIQNDETKINLFLQEQPDLQDIEKCYRQKRRRVLGCIIGWESNWNDRAYAKRPELCNNEKNFWQKGISFAKSRAGFI